MACKTAIQQGKIKFLEYLENKCSQWISFDTIKYYIKEILNEDYQKIHYPFAQPTAEMLTYLSQYLHAELKEKFKSRNPGCNPGCLLYSVITHKLENIPQALSQEDCEIYAYLLHSTDSNFFKYTSTDAQKETLSKHSDFKQYQESLKDSKQKIKEILKKNIQRIQNTDRYWGLFFSKGKTKTDELRKLVSNVENSLTISDIRELLEDSLRQSVIKEVRSLTTEKTKSIQAIEKCISILDDNPNLSKTLGP